MKRIVSGTMLTLLLVGMSAFGFRTRLAKTDMIWALDSGGVPDFLEMRDAVAQAYLADASSAIKHWSPQTVKSFFENRLDDRSMDDFYQRFEASGQWDFGSKADFGGIACFDDDSAELVIGLSDVAQNSYVGLVDLIGSYGGELVNTIQMDGKVSAVVADIPHRVMYSFKSKVEIAGLSRYIESNARVEIDFVPNDPNWTMQWGPRRIEADYAWNTTMGDSSVLVAVIDTGIDWDHPDLAANYVPLGYDWVNNDTDPMDDFGHGTHCAGIIGAVIDNNIGIAGLAQVRIMAEKALDRYGSGSEDDLANAIIHAVDQGADILSNSWGVFGESALIHEAVNYAYDHGALVIAAAGNDASECKQLPASCEEVMSVTATDQSDRPALWTNFGEWVEIAAPGVGVYSSWWNDTYASSSGTSMSAPHVAGVAALIWSQFPNMTQDQVRAKLRFTVEDLGDFGFDEYYGYGRINARRAVEQSLPDHDLTLLYWQVPSILKSFDTAMINATLLNFGAHNESDITVRLLVNGSVTESVFINHLASGNSTKTSFVWSPPLEGRYNVTLYVEPVHDETLTGNNILFRHVIVRVLDEVAVPNDFPTIQKAINEVASGYTIRVKPGIYYEHVIISKSVTLIGEDPQATIIDGRGIEKAVWLVYASNISITGFTIQNSSYGMLLYVSNNNNINGNVITHNVEGMKIAYSGGNTLTHNNITGNECNLGVTGSYLSHFVNHVNTSNTADGKPVCYLVNQQNLVIDATTFPNVGYLAVVNSVNITVRDLDFTKNGQGVLLAYTNSSTIENINTSDNLHGILLVNCFGDTVHNNRIMNNLYGMDLWDSHNNTVIRNNITRCFDGICLDSCSNNVVQDNKITLLEYKQAFGEKRWGINFFFSRNNTIFNNEITETHTAIYVFASNCNRIANNTIANNGIGNRCDYSGNNTVSANLITQNSVGIHLKASSDNVIYHNDIIKNEKQVVSEDSINKWDDNYPSGGNYWSDYAGVDLHNGPYQNETGGDGIGDKRYAIDADNRDHYPLWFPWSLPPAAHELIVFLDAPTIIPPGYHSILNATVVNKGLNNETYVELSLMIDGSIVNSTIISSLQAGSSYTIDHQWTPIIESTYNVTAFTPPVPNEEDTTDNVVTKKVTVSLGTSIYVDPQETIIWLGKTFTVDIIVTAVEDLYTWQVTLYFDPAVIKCTTAIYPSNHIFADRPAFFICWIENTLGYVVIAATLLGDIPGFTGTGTLCQVTFKAIGLGTSDLTFRPYSEIFPKTLLITSEMHLLPDVMLIDGTVEVEPIPGDINRDGKVDMRDVAMAALAFGSYPSHSRWNPNADVNKDNKVDMRDIASIARNFGKTGS